MPPPGGFWRVGHQCPENIFNFFESFKSFSGKGLRQKCPDLGYEALLICVMMGLCPCRVSTGGGDFLSSTHFLFSLGGLTMTTATTARATVRISNGVWEYRDHSIRRESGSRFLNIFRRNSDGKWALTRRGLLSGRPITRLEQAREWIDWSLHLRRGDENGSTPVASQVASKTTADIKPGDVFANSHRDFAECIIVTEVSDKGVMFEDYDGNEGFLACYVFEDDDAEDGLWPSHWQRLATDHQQWWGWRLVELWTEFRDLTDTCERLRCLECRAGSYVRRRRLGERQQEIAKEATSKRDEIRRAVKLLRFSLEN